MDKPLLLTVMILSILSSNRENAKADTASRLESYKCLFNYAENYASDVVRSSTPIIGIESGYYYRYFDISDSYLAINESDNQLYLYQPRVSSSITPVGDADHWLGESKCSNQPLTLFTTSYGNDHEREIAPFYLPQKLTEIYSDEHDWLTAVGQADFTQNGELELVTHSHHAAFRDGTFGDGTAFQYGEQSDIRFWRRNHEDTRWIEITNSLLDNNKGCMLARKALVADFNNDNKPDVFFSCTGHRRSDNVVDDSEILFEKPVIVLSQPDGTYRNTYAIDYEAEAHGAAAGDLNGDGFVDVVITDNKEFEAEPCSTCNGGTKYTLTRGRSIWFLWNQGDGIFDLSDGINILPPDIYNDVYGYSTIEIIDIDNDGHFDIYIGGRDVDWVLYNDGSGKFDNRPQEIPKDDRFADTLDVMKLGNNLYIYSINTDSSKPHYYWGDALSKVDLFSFSAEIVYEHEGFYRTNGKCEFVSCMPWVGDDGLDSWFPWLTTKQGKIMPLDKAYDFVLYSLD